MEAPPVGRNREAITLGVLKIVYLIAQYEPVFTISESPNGR